MSRATRVDSQQDRRSTFSIYKGIAELIETLGTRRWRLSSDAPPEVNLSSFNNELFTTIESNHQEKGRDLWVLDISDHLNLPFFAFVAVYLMTLVQKTVLQGTAASHTPEKGDSICTLRMYSDATKFDVVPTRAGCVTLGCPKARTRFRNVDPKNELRPSMMAKCKPRYPYII